MLSKKEKIVYGLVATIFMFLQLVCRTLEVKGNIEWNIKIVLVCLAISILFAVLCLVAVWLVQKYKPKFSGKPTEITKKTAGGKLFFLSWGLIFVCWIPYFLAYYPGILAYDSYIQIGQIVNDAYNNHHPLIHTFTIGVFLKIGEALGSANLGVGLYTLTQMLCLSATMAAGVLLLAKKGVKRIWLGLVVLYCALCPVNGYLAVSMTKDVFFTVFVLLFAFVVLHILEGGKQHFLWDLAYVLVTVLMILFRNNGKYALLAFLGLYALLYFGEFLVGKRKKEALDKEELKEKRVRALRLAGGAVVSLVLSSVILSGFNRSVSAQEGDKREMLSIPIQQIARCMVYHGGLELVENGDDTISAQDKALIDEFILYNGYLNYDPLISDPVKSCTNTWVVVNKMKEFVSMYLGLAADYPGEYVNAFLAVNGGYLSVLDESHAQVNLNEGIEGLGYIQTRWEEASLNPVGIYKDSKWQGLYTALETFAGTNGYLEIPVLRNVIAPGAYFWCYLVLGIWAFFRREKKVLLPLFFVAGYYVTLLLGPTVQLRYLYPVMLLLPFVYLYTLYSKKIRA